MDIVCAWSFTRNDLCQPPYIVSTIPSQSVITGIVHVAYRNAEQVGTHTLISVVFTPSLFHADTITWRVYSKRSTFVKYLNAII